MKIKIDSKGFLKILRQDGYKYQICPLNLDGNYCGDHCPLFSIYERVEPGGEVFFRELRLCHSMYQLDGFEQEKQQQLELTFADEPAEKGADNGQHVS